MPRIRRGSSPLVLSLLWSGLAACGSFPPDDPEVDGTSTQTSSATTLGSSSGSGASSSPGSGASSSPGSGASSSSGASTGDSSASSSSGEPGGASTSDTGGSTSGTGGSTSDTGGSTSDTGASTSDTDASTSDTGGSTSDTGASTGESTGGVDTDSDADGILDALDNCPFDHNPFQNDGDGDPWGDACDSCPYSPGTGGAPDDNCCDPRTGAASCVEPPFAAQLLVCRLDDPGTRFTCEYHVLGCLTNYGYSCDCPLEMPCLPDESLVPENFLGTIQCIDGGSSCQTRWCTIGGDPDQCREYASGIWNNGSPNQPTCMPFFAPGTEPGGLADLGICMKDGLGPCSGLLGSECATWGT